MKLPLFLTRAIKRRCWRVVASRPCDLAIGGRADTYLERWYLIPRNRFFNLYLHRILRSDDDRALHDHPWASVSICLAGQMREHMPGERTRDVFAGVIVFRSSRSAHRLELTGPYCLTLFATGPRIREWGFHCPESSPAGGWRHWKEFTGFEQDGNSTRIGRGCGE